MFINPKEAIEKGWIAGIRNPTLQIQPNAIDFTLDKLFDIDNNNMFIISTDPITGKEVKKMRGGEEIHAVQDRATDIEFFHIRWNCPRTFDAASDVYVELPEGVAAITVIRSTFNRNGIFMTSGLYDSGYKGHLGFALHCMSGQAKIEKGTRVGQIIFVKSENAGIYAGGYNHQQGTHYTEKKEDVK